MHPCRATRAGTQAPPLPISIIFFHASHTNKITIYAQSTQTTPTIPRVIHPKRNQPSTRNPPKRNRRGGACVPARTSAQRRFHNRNTRIVRGHERWKRPCGAKRAGTQRRFHTQMNEYNYTTHRGRKCIAHSRPHS